MKKYSFIFIFFFIHLCVLVCFSTAQRNGPWRHKIKWETNGQVYSLLGSGSQYHTVSGKHTRFLLTRHMMPTGRISMGRFANRMHTVGHVVHSNSVPEHSPGKDAKHHMMSGRTSPMRNNQLSFHAERTALSSHEALRTQFMLYGTAATTEKPTLTPVKASRAPGHHNTLTKTPKRTSATVEKPPTINIEDPLQLSTSTGSKSANNTKLSSRTSSASPSAYVNNRNTGNPPFQVEERGGETMIGDEATNPHVNSRNSFYFNLLPYGSANRFPHRETGQGSRYFHNGKTTF